MTEPITYDRANVAQKVVRRIAGSGPGAWVFARVMPRIDRPVFALTRGRYTVASFMSGLPVVMLTTTGVKTAQLRTVPLLGIPTRGAVAIIASNFGQYRYPAWYHNLRAHPEAAVVIERATRTVRAVEAEGERRSEIWQNSLRIYPGFGAYQRRAAHRAIVIFVLEPI